MSKLTLKERQIFRNAVILNHDVADFWVEDLVGNNMYGRIALNNLVEKGYITRKKIINPMTNKPKYLYMISEKGYNNIDFEIN